MSFKNLLAIAILITIKFNGLCQENLTLRDALRYKTWYVIKIISETESKLLWPTVISCSDDKPYLFSLVATDRSMRKDYSTEYGTFPRELIIEPNGIYFRRAKMDSSFERIYFKVNSYTEDFLDMSDDKDFRYLMISDFKH